MGWGKGSGVVFLLESLLLWVAYMELFGTASSLDILEISYGANRSRISHYGNAVDQFN